MSKPPLKIGFLKFTASRDGKLRASVRVELRLTPEDAQAALQQIKHELSTGEKINVRKRFMELMRSCARIGLDECASGWDETYSR